MIGSSLNQYRITASIGAGGMGEVFRARDTRLNRDVAIKVLPKDFAADADRQRRFEQEAKTLAALNHPNILTIHDAGMHDGAPYLVSELLRGQTLREVLGNTANTPLPVCKATDYALQTAQGLAAAHGKGVVHRDLKPENLFVTQDGRVKILDFGLAKLKDPSPGLRPPSPHPMGRGQGEGPAEPGTIRIDAEAIINTTQPGMVLGTPAYMSPEQVRGEPADHRADIFAFGAVLYEMLSGTRAFRRDTPVESMNAVLSEEPPPLSASHATIPPAFERIVHRCLEKQPARRFQSADDLAFAIEALGSVSTNTHLTAARSRSSRAVPWIVTVLVVAAGLATWLISHRTTVTPPGQSGSPPVLRKFEIHIPPASRDGNMRIVNVAISPDGKKLAYVNADGLWVRRLDQLKPAVLLIPGEGLAAPFWSPRSTDLAWFEADNLKRAPIEGGRAITICRLPDRPSEGFFGAGGVWLDGDEILFTLGKLGLTRVSADGGNTLEVLSPAPGEAAFHHLSALPGKGVMFVVRRQQAEPELPKPDTIAVWNHDDPKQGKRVLLQRPGSQLRWPVYSSPGHVLFIEVSPEGPELWAIPVSPSTFQPAGNPFRLSEIALRVSASADGTLALLHLMSYGEMFHPRQLVWVDRTGKAGAPFGPVHKGLHFQRLSPDERSVLFSTQEESLAASRTWILDLPGGTAMPFPSSVSEDYAEWLPSGREMAISIDDDKPDRMAVIRPVEGTGPIKTVGRGLLLHVSPSGEHAFLRTGGSGRPVTNYYVRLTSEPFVPVPLPGSSPNLVNRPHVRPDLSPDNATLAFQSDENGGPEVWAAAFPAFTNRVMVSRGAGGLAPQWSRDGKELFYLTEDAVSIMAAPLESQRPARFGPPVKLFDIPATVYRGVGSARTRLFDPSADGQRFLMLYNVPAANTATPELGTSVLLIQNWFEEFREKK
jgi:serine/threonine protein kinase